MSQMPLVSRNNGRMLMVRLVPLLGMHRAGGQFGVKWLGEVSQRGGGQMTFRVVAFFTAPRICKLLP